MDNGVREYIKKKIGEKRSLYLDKAEERLGSDLFKEKITARYLVVPELNHSSIDEAIQKLTSLKQGGYKYIGTDLERDDWEDPVIRVYASRDDDTETPEEIYERIKVRLNIAIDQLIGEEKDNRIKELEERLKKYEKE